jgi:hypothetical protein
MAAFIVVFKAPVPLCGGFCLGETFVAGENVMLMSKYNYKDYVVQF